MSYDQWKTASPYDDEEWSNEEVETAFSGDFDGPYELYRQVYKSVDCGPTIGFLVSYIEPEHDYGMDGEPYEKQVDKYLYCDDLIELGSWRDMRERGILIKEMSVSSIVEGVDQCTEPEFVQVFDDELEGDDIRKRFFAAVEETDRQAEAIWRDTHGCPDCFDYPPDVLHRIDPQCPTCHGQGTLL